VSPKYDDPMLIDRIGWTNGMNVCVKKRCAYNEVGMKQGEKS